MKAKEAEILRVESDDNTKLLKMILDKFKQPPPPEISVVENVDPKAQIVCQWCNQVGHALNKCFLYKQHLEEQKSHPSHKSEHVPCCHWCHGTDHTMNRCEAYKAHCQQIGQHNQPQIIWLIE